MSDCCSSFDKFEVKYCSLCDLYFYSKALLYQHMQDSSRHPRCKTCNRSYLNKNSLRNHYVISSKHNYCRPCDKLFAKPSGLRIHLRQSRFHSDDSDDEYEYESEENDADGEAWEDGVARELDAEERRNQTEEEIKEEKDEGAMSSIERRAKMMEFMARRRRETSIAETSDKSKDQTVAYSYTCPVCLSCPKSVSALRCGHLFCNSCIVRSIDENNACPSCRKEAVMAHVRKIDLRVY
ncbi:hypothetical protein FPV67DRAFT_1452659 [Lyophyllum atratum]|nr:hypothetical protein FPV67DRAFT_1452659 [Lyophyllum atratum]